MSDQVAQPSRKPADDDSLGGALRTILTKFLQGVDDCLPARAVAFVRTTARATIHPLIQMVTTSGQRVSRAHVASVPVYQMGAGGFLISFPVRPGDHGFLKACDRDTSLFLQGGGEAQPNTQRLHSFSDGVWFPAVLSGFTIPAEDEANLVIQTLDGSVRISLSPDRVKITGNVEVDGTITATGNVIGAGISLNTHHHTGVQSGDGTSRGPV